MRRGETLIVLSIEAARQARNPKGPIPEKPPSPPPGGTPGPPGGRPPRRV